MWSNKTNELIMQASRDEARLLEAQTFPVDQP